MNSKEKCDELCTKFWNHEYFEHTNILKAERVAKEQALITVEEILNIFEDAADVFESEHDLNLNERAWDYWLEVKKELENM